MGGDFSTPLSRRSTPGVTTPERCRGALSKTKAKLRRLSHGLKNITDQFGTMTRASLYSLSCNDLQIVKNDLLKQEDFLKRSVQDIEHQVFEMLDTVDTAFAATSKMQRTLDAVLCDM